MFLKLPRLVYLLSLAQKLAPPTKLGNQPAAAADALK
jgi:hypothetical protein